MEWRTAQTLVDYPDALAQMSARVTGIQQGTAEELVWLIEHPPLYTLGTSAKESDVLANSSPRRGEARRGAPLAQSNKETLCQAGPHPPTLLQSFGGHSPNPSPLGEGIPLYTSGRGGQVTYHGPGQRVAYVMRDLKNHAARRGEAPDLRAYVADLERWIMLTLAAFGIEGFLREGRVGVWVQTPQGEAKIAALGVRIQKWVTSHGIALNVAPDLSHYAGIVPCGIREYGVTSLQALGVDATLPEVDAVLRTQFDRVFS